jgi:protein TonB
MTALSIAAGAYFPSLRLNWPRVTAYSGSVSLHLLLAAMLLIPPAAMELQQVIKETHTDAVIIPLPPELAPEPKLPVPPVKARHVESKRPTPLITITAPIPTPIPVQSPVDSIAGPGANQHADRDSSARDGGADAAPSALAYNNRTEVPYPFEAMRRREQGTVMLRVLVGTDGKPGQIEIERSSGSHALDIAARDAVRRWSFRPGMRGGVAYAAWARVPISFKLPQ